MPQPIDSGSTQDAVWKGIGPFRNVEIRGYDGAFSFITFSDDIMEVLILRALERFETEVIDNV
jgi:predicted xylose isomerase-like sugar epimerase